MLNIVFTFDYEVFFGDNYCDEEQVLFQPTDSICSLLEQHSISGVFFADILSAVAYRRECPDNKYPQRFDSQLRDIAIRGHDVQLHLHTHWITGRYVGKWKFDSHAFRVHKFFEKGMPCTVEEIVNDGVSYLNDLLLPVKPDYVCNAFRAGGFCSQPTQDLMKILAGHNIRIDSSAPLGKKMHTETHQFEYEEYPPKLNYEVNNRVIELPIGSVRNNFVKRFAPFTGWGQMEQEKMRGCGIAGSFVKESRLHRLLTYNDERREMGLEFMPHKQVLFGLNLYYDRYHCRDKDSYIALICHPKAADKYTFRNIDNVIRGINEHKEKFRIVSLQEMIQNCPIGEF